MAAEENTTRVRRFYEEFWNTGALELLDELFAPDFADHNAPPGLAPGLEGLKQFTLMLRAAFPDIQFSIEDGVAEADKVVTRWTLRGTHQGTFQGTPPTG